MDEEGVECFGAKERMKGAEGIVNWIKKILTKRRTHE